MNINRERLSKRQWYNLGGFANPVLYRKQVGGAWHYFRATDYN